MGLATLRSAATGAILVAAALPAAGAACGSRPEAAACPTTPMPGLAIAVGARANTPAPSLPAQLADRLEQAVAEQQGITLVRVDGEPTIACVLRFRTDAGNEVARQHDQQQFRHQLQQAVAAVRAHQPEADPLSALGIAAAAAGPDGTVVLVDSGLQTVPPLDFSQPGLLDQVLAAGPEAVAAQLGEAVPDLRGRDVVLAGLGYTAAPQARLDLGRQQRLVALWKGLVAAAGARSVTVVADARTDPSVTAVPEVAVVDVPPPRDLPLGCDTTTELYDTGPVGFLPDSTDFVDPAAAAEALAGFGAWLAGNPSGRAEVTGNIAHYGSNRPDHGLARARAEMVAAELVRLGARPEQVRAVGGGWGPHPAPDAPPDPRYDPLNRRVVIALRCT